MIAEPYPGVVEPEELSWQKHYRIVPSRFPPVNLFERLVDPELMDALFYLESLTNDRLRQEAGDISRVPDEDRVSGPGATPVMAAFTHTGRESRFSDGSYGAYYAGNSIDTAIEETRYHRETFLRYTHEDPGEIDMRVYIGRVQRPLHDIRSHDFDFLHEPDNWNPSQAFGAILRGDGSWGIVYRSVRHLGGECIAALRPPAVSIPKQGLHLCYVWDGEGISSVLEKKLLRTGGSKPQF